jgi:hypothetical protein
MSDDTKDFVGMSAVLTGFAASVLQPATDALNQAGQYLAFLEGPDSGVADAMAALLDVYRANQGKTPEAIGQAILASPSAELARRIIKLWYSGSWYGPFDASTGAAAELRVVSSQAYTYGLAWRAAQAHPMGYSMLRFGYWNANPPALSAFTGESNDG